jgi:SAM-dependent methyltransferase
MPRARVRPLTARTADKHVLYQEAVQGPEVDAAFLDRWFRRCTGRAPRLLREDFCGTAILSCRWVQQRRDHRAVGVDLHAPTLAWGRAHNLSRLTGEERARVRLLRRDVLHVRRPKADVIAALNFSYCVFKTRPRMLAYLRNTRRSLERGGMLFLDAWGGSLTQLEQCDRRRNRGFTYLWEQVSFDPVTYHTVCKIHFEFPDGSRIRDAFTYDWRLWTLPELREMMAEAGFRGIQVLWEGTDRRTGKGNGRFRRVRRGEADRAWIAYITGRA